MPLHPVCLRVHHLVLAQALVGSHMWDLEAESRTDLVEGHIGLVEDRIDLVEDLGHTVVVDRLGQEDQEDPGDGSAVGVGCGSIPLLLQRPHPQLQLPLRRRRRNQAFVAGREDLQDLEDLAGHRALRLADLEDFEGLGGHQASCPADFADLEGHLGREARHMDEDLDRPADTGPEALGHKREGYLVPVDSHQAQRAEVDRVRESLDLVGLEVGHEHPEE